MENPIEMDALGVPLFLETPILNHGFVHKFVSTSSFGEKTRDSGEFLKVDAHQVCVQKERIRIGMLFPSAESSSWKYPNKMHTANVLILWHVETAPSSTYGKFISSVHRLWVPRSMREDSLLPAFFLRQARCTCKAFMAVRNISGSSHPGIPPWEIWKKVVKFEHLGEEPVSDLWERPLRFNFFKPDFRMHLGQHFLKVSNHLKNAHGYLQRTCNLFFNLECHDAGTPIFFSKMDDPGCSTRYMESITRTRTLQEAWTGRFNEFFRFL